MKDHSLEEMRSALLEVLRQTLKRDPKDVAGYYSGLKNLIAEYWKETEKKDAPPQNNFGMVRTYSFGSETSQLSGHDVNLFQEVFWEFVRQGVLCFKLEDLQRGEVVYRITQWGQQYLSSGNEFRFHDGASYGALVKSRVPRIHPSTLAYLQEAAQAHAMGCYGAAGLTLAVALEHSIALLLGELRKNAKTASTFASVWEQDSPDSQLQTFISILRNHSELVPPPVSADLDTKLAAVSAIIRRFRDGANQPTGQMQDREDSWMHLQLFLPCCQKIYQLKEALS